MLFKMKSAVRKSHNQRRKIKFRLPQILALALSLSVFSSSLAAASADTEEEKIVFEPVVLTEYCVMSASSDALDGTSPPDAEYIKNVISESFEEQDAGVYINGSAYPFAVQALDGTAFVSAREFIELLYDAECSESGGSFAAYGENFSFFANEGSTYVTVNERFIPCQPVKYDDLYGVLVDILSAAASLSLSVETTGEEYYIKGDVMPAENGETYYPAEDLYWLSHIISAESMTEPLEGKIAVGNVVLNRVASDLFPDSVKEVVLDKRYGIIQFSPVGAGTVYNEPDEESVIAAKLCLEGAVVSDEIIFFMNPALATSSWISDNRTAVVTIGRHTFYS